VRVNGQDAAPVYKFLKASKPGFFGSRIKWNFTKFLVGKDGKVIERYATSTTPFSIEVSLSVWIESLIFCTSLCIGFEFTEGHPEGS
jgi:glutathione peroxidase